MKRISEIVFDLIANKKSVLFCGSGISYNSGIPTVAPFIDYLLKKLDIQDSHIDIFKKANFPFEATMEIIGEFVKVKPLLNVFNVENPNANHYLIALLFQRDLINIIITTNFDRNIEVSLNHVGLIEGRDFEILIDSEEIELFKYDPQKKYLIKIHGSIENSDSLLTFIERIATRSNQNLIYEFLKKVFTIPDKDNILFFGYSFSDDFDINPALELIDNSSKVMYIIEHQSELLPEEIKDKTDPKTFRKSQKIKCNFDKLVDELYSAFQLQSFTVNANPVWKTKIDNWVYNDLNQQEKNDKGLNDKIILSLNLFFKIRSYEVVDYYLRKPLDSNWPKRNILFRMEIFSKTSALYTYYARFKNDRKGYEIAVDNYRSALLLAQSVNDKFNEALYASGLAHCYVKLQNYDEAEKLLVKSIEYFEERSYHPDEPNPDLARKHYVGSVFTLAACFRTAGDYTRALPIYEHALLAATEFGHLETKSLILYGFGLLYSDLNNYKKAEMYFFDSYSIAKKLKIYDRITECFRELCYLKSINVYDEAKIFYEKEEVFIKLFAPDLPSLDTLLANMAEQKLSRSNSNMS